MAIRRKRLVPLLFIGLVAVVGPPSGLRTVSAPPARTVVPATSSPAPALSASPLVAGHARVPAAAAQALVAPLRDVQVSVSSSGFFSWALLDRRTGSLTGSANLNATNNTASMVKAWIAADYLRVTVERGARPTAS